MNIAIVADDLTSATDGIAEFAQRGWCAHVVRAPRGLRDQRVIERADVLAIDVSSRTMPSAEAVLHVEAAASAIAGVRTLIKQFDSTLRGHIAAECVAMLRATRRRRLIVAPAFPSAGRTTVGGEQRVNGIPVHKTAYANDRLNPVPSSDLRSLFEAEGIRVSGQVGDDGAVLILDSASENDLECIAREYIHHSDVVLAGSTGLVRAIARVCGESGNVGTLTSPCSRRSLVVVGSLNDLSRQQLGQLRKLSVPIVTVSETDDPSAVAQAIERGFAAGHGVAALVSTDTPAVPRLIRRQIALTTFRLIDRRAIDGLIVTGGDTVGAILEHLHATSLSVHREIEPGIPLCTLAEPYSIPLISKAGGFGSLDVFVNAVKMLAGPHFEGAA